MNERQPLVSVAIVAYNASSTIIEALDSVFAQTYPNIELVIADDCSTDNTVILCNKWIETHKGRFSDCRVISNSKNMGLSYNYNIAYGNCKAKWIKELDADDALLPNCISDCIEYVLNHDDVVLLFAKVAPADDISRDISNRIFDYTLFNLSIDELLRRTYQKNQIPAQTVFLNIFEMRKIGLKIDETIEMIEDHPLWINAMRMGVRLHFLDKEIVKYRVSESSISNNLVSLRYYRSLLQLYITYLHDEQFKMDHDKAAKLLYDTQVSIYGSLYQAYLIEKNKSDSVAYKIGYSILLPYRYTKQFFKKVSQCLNI